MPKKTVRQVKPVADADDLRLAMRRALNRAREGSKPVKTYKYPVKPPELMKGVVPDGTKALVAMDSDPAYGAPYSYIGSLGSIGGGEWVGFPGYAYLSLLSTRAEYRMFAQAIATQLTREWIVLNSTETSGDSTKKKITEITQDLKELDLRGVIHLMAEHDSYFGRAQLFLNLEGQDKELPLALSSKTIKKQTIKEGESIKKYFTVKAIEPIWTTPNFYNASDPSADNFYVPSSWFMMGMKVHATRLLTVITRPVADILKPAFNFGGMSMSQLAEPYVDNWLRTRQSVADLINNFSIVALSTSMDAALQGKPEASDSLFDRIELFTLTRSNKGAMVLDKDRESLDVLNVPLGGLAELQSQSQEQMCSVSHTPAVELLGVAPSGFGNVAEGEIRSHYDWVAAIWEAYWQQPVEIVVQIIQLIRYGMIDPDIIVTAQPLYQMTPKELAEIRTADANTDGAYLDRNVIDPVEVREKLARNPESGYQGIDITKVPAGATPGIDDLNYDPTAQGGENEDVP